jgi:hypothetical protein
MNAPDDIDARLATWLEDGPSRAPAHSIDHALDHARAHPRRRELLAILRKDPMNARTMSLDFVMRPLALVGVLALVLAAGFAAATVGGFLPDRPAVAPPIAAPSPTPLASPAATVSPTATVSGSAPAPSVLSVDLIEHVGANATIDITDYSGHLVDARSGDPGDGASVPADTITVSSLAASSVAGAPAWIVLRWSGMPCDTTHHLTIDPDGLTMTIERPACQGDAMGVDHVLVLIFDRPVDPAAVKASLRTLGG